MSSGTPDDDATVQFPPVSGQVPTAGFAIAPPGGPRRAIHSWLFYFAAVSALPTTFWIFSSRIGWHPILVVPSIALTIAAGVLVLLRYWRGSQLDAEERLFHERHSFYDQANADPLSVAIMASNRIGQQLVDGEYVIWEFRKHPMSLVPVWWNHIIRSRVGGVLTGTYILVLALFFSSDMVSELELPWWTYVCFAILPVPYFGYTIAEWNADRFALTNMRFIGVVGLTKTQFGAIPRATILDQVQTASGFAHFLAWLRIIDTPYGRLVFETPGPVRGNLPEVVTHLTHIAHNLAKYQPRKI